MANVPRVLIALATPEARTAISRALPTSGLDPVFTSSVRELRSILSQESVDVVICEDRLNDGDYRDVLNVMASRLRRVPVVVASHVDDTREYLEAMKLGAFDFIAAPYRRAEVEWIIEHALGRVPSTVR